MRLSAHFGQWLEVGRQGRKARQWQVAVGLIYGQVKKSYRQRKLMRVTHVMRIGTSEALQVALQGLGFSGRLNTAFIERVNLSVRHGVAALTRRTWATFHQAPHLLGHLEWWRAYYHGCRVLTNHYEWRWCSHECEVANVWRNGTGSLRQPWQREERTDDGQRGRCSLAHCRQFPLENLSSQMWSQYHIVERSMKVRAEVVGWSLLPGYCGLPGLHTDEKGSLRGFEEADHIIHHQLRLYLFLLMLFKTCIFGFCSGS